jgi:tetratricopeptide (TPR) repeat protein
MNQPEPPEPVSRGAGGPGAAGGSSASAGSRSRGPAAGGARQRSTPRAGAGRPRTTSAAQGRGRSQAPSARRDEIERRTYDPRREERRRAARVPIPDEVDPRMLDQEVRAELRPLARDTADTVARHLVVAGRLLEDDPQQALVHARAARALAGRVGPVREAAGLAAYLAGEWAEALAELRAERRISGSAAHLPVLADCERALGRPERALAVGDDPAVPSLPQDVRVELAIVLAGARRDLGQVDAAVVQLQEPARRTSRRHPWAARLWYAYADALLAAGREQEARDWFAAAAEADGEAVTDAEERLLELDGVVLEDLQDDGSDQQAAGSAEQEQAAPTAGRGVSGPDPHA